MDSEASPHYMRVALCIANSIVKGNHIVGEKLFGQSTLSTEYGVSPETIRRAMCLLADMKIVESKKHSGTFVLSVDNAARFIDEYRKKQ
ncbi:MAG: GntR family transcriptional regulator, partial [Clostridia bacterium]|nr:GntR family transcriptional regulator [Clostridia bacterium]